MKKLKLPEGGELFDAEERELGGNRYSWDRYVHKESRSGWFTLQVNTSFNICYLPCAIF